MDSYTTSPYVSFIESRLVPGEVRSAVFHRLTGDVLEPSDRVRSILLTARAGVRISLSTESLRALGSDGEVLAHLIAKKFFIDPDADPLEPFLTWFPVRPIQSPALAYKSSTGDTFLVRTSSERSFYSPERDQLPQVIEEKMAPNIAGLFHLADGTRILEEVFEKLGVAKHRILQDSICRGAIDYLTSQDHQLIKLVLLPEHLEDPFQPCNCVPRSYYHSARWNDQKPNGSGDIVTFHLDGIEDARWEFDMIEPTVNHSFRFPSDALGGFDYGSRFCVSTLCPDVLPSVNRVEQLDVLEVGAGTGSFARSFQEQAKALSEAGKNLPNMEYHILDLSPVLMENQKKLLSDLSSSHHFQQDATRFDIPGRKFHLIIANEVVADFPVATVTRSATGDSIRWDGAGARDMYEYSLPHENAPDSFLINEGTFRFIERAWEHLSDGGSLIISEYGGRESFPSQAYHLNHEEFSIHFGHLISCATKIGFKTRLLTLKEFLHIDDEVFVLSGREEHIVCLNHILQKYDKCVPFAVVSKAEFERSFQAITQSIDLVGYSFSRLKEGYHFGPRIEDFMVLILTKPQRNEI